MLLLRYFSTWMIISNFVFQLMSTKNLLSSPKLQQNILIGVYWLLWSMCLTLSIYSCSKDKSELFVWILGLLWVRNCIPFIDIEERHLSGNATASASFFIAQSIALLITQVLMNLVTNRFVFIPQSIMSVLAFAYGSVSIFRPPSTSLGDAFS